MAPSADAKASTPSHARKAVRVANDHITMQGKMARPDKVAATTRSTSRPGKVSASAVTASEVTA